MTHGLLLLLQLSIPVPVSFGALRDLELDFIPVQCVLLIPPAKGAAQLAVLAQDGEALRTFEFGREGGWTQTFTLPLTPHAARIRQVDIDRNTATDLVALHNTPPSFSVYVRTKTGFRSRSFTIEGPAAEISEGDVNNDGRQDLLLFGRTEPGVRVYFGDGKGNFAAGPTLVAERSVADLHAADLNRDGITDLLFLDWLANELVLQYGIGRGVFSEQSSIRLPDEPAHLAVTPLTRVRTFGVIVSLARRSEVLVFEGNAAGELELREHLDTRDEVKDLRVASVTGDTTPDLIMLTSGSIAVCAGLAPHMYSAPTHFGAGAGCSSLAVGDLDGDHLPEAAIVHGESRRLRVLGNAGGRWGSGKTLYGVGGRPGGMAVRDLNGDGLLDLAVVNSASASVSILLNRGGGAFDGQHTVMLDDAPMFLRAVGPVTRPTRTLVTSGSANDRVTVLSVGQSIPTSTTTTIPTGPAPYVVSARSDSSGGLLDMIVRYDAPSDRSLSLFERIRDRQFIERSLRPADAARIVALTVGELGAAAGEDLIVVTRQGPPARLTVSVASATGRFLFGTPREVFSLPDTTATRVAVAVAPVNPDPFNDLLLLLGPPSDALVIAYGTEGEGLGNRYDRIDRIRPVHEDMLLVRDVDGDGRNDIITVDGLRGAVVVAYQKQDGGFRPPVSVVPAPAVGGMRIAPIFAPGTHDVLLTLPESGAVSVIPDPFAR